MPPGLLALASAELRDLTRRPTFRVGALALGAWFALLPRLSNPAAGVRDNAALAVGLAGTTAVLLASLFAALAAVRVVHREGTTGFALEDAAAPLSVEVLLVGRLAGCAAAALALVALGAAIGVVGWWWAGPPADIRAGDALMQGVVLLPCAAALGAALGAACGSLLSRDLAVLATVALVVGARVLCSALAPVAPWAGWVVPDPGRLDVAREIAFGRPVGVGALALQAASACAWTVGAGLLAAAALRRRRGAS